MAVSIKSPREIEYMRTAGRYLGGVLEELLASVRVGWTTAQVNDLGEKLIRSKGCVPNFLHYEGFPASFCVSLNDEVVHGIPSKKRVIREGDMLSIDGGLIYKGMHADAARSIIMGEGTAEARQLLEVTKESFFRGIAQAKEGNHLHDISNAIAAYVEPYGYGIVQDLTGHGIGKHLHEDPQIPNYPQKTRGIRLKAGMTLAIEPMINLGGWEVDFSEEDGWTCTTRDHSISAHYENTILITDGEAEILTLGGSTVSS